MNPQRIILDVRMEEGFAGKHIAGSVNIPLHEIPDHLPEIKSMSQPLILWCISGNRSNQATAYLKRPDIEYKKGGSRLHIS